jgi:hypothetical protein
MNLDANTLALWNMSLAGALLADEAPGARHLTRQANNLLVPGLFGIGQATQTNGSTSWVEHPGDATIRAWAQGEWTIEVVARPGGTGTFFAISSINDRILASFGAASSGRLTTKWENTSTNDEYIAYSSNGAYLSDAWGHFAAVKRAEGGGTYAVDFYVNGEAKGSATGLTNCAAVAGGQKVYVLAHTDGGITTGLANGPIASVRLSTAKRTQAELAASWEQALDGILPVRADADVASVEKTKREKLVKTANPIETVTITTTVTRRRLRVNGRINGA